MDMPNNVDGKGVACGAPWYVSSKYSIHRMHSKWYTDIINDFYR